ncbi:peptidase S9 prolyl oligopeptidase [Oscillatoria nigro-viridis PCC 7112]|uniref:Peptidase S9 prolyl oligopeptidase n=1 Tax=Phormidium nigroviride PCC 7112 TaxID=179408 RepID=K9VH17_9CYAN|nr:S9 family peptidase [Oscillatoria nigro-viridis]AFZ06787.1 peptidase S9 prolyl oligopeptidase [Oscillatoria nigro-viridis PCC 7112]
MQTHTFQQSKTELPPLIEREILFGNPEKTSPQLSPDGKYLAYIAPDENNVLQVQLRTVGQADDRQLTADKKRGIRIFLWTYSGEELIYLQDTDGDENWHLFSVNIQSNLVRDLTPFQGVQAYPIALDRNFPNEILVGMNIRDRSKHDVYRINLKNGAVEFDTDNPGNIVGWTADAQFQVRAATATTADGGSELVFRETADKSWESLRTWGPDEEGGALMFSENGKILYIIGNHDANAERSIALDLETKQETDLASDPEYDVGDILIHPTKREIQAVSFYKDKQEWQILDQSIADDFEAIGKFRPGEFDLTSRNLADTTWLIAYRTDDGPVYYYTYDRASKTCTFLFSNQPKLEGLPLSSMEPISYTARDGLTIHGYLTKPVGVATPVPTVLLVHGGPWGRDTWGYDSEAQWLSNRGYAVLQINFRGSAGYGKAFLNAGNREWAGKMHDDLLDGVNWLVETGISQQDKIAIMGGSYGGYAALVGVTFTPDVFACAVDIVGPSNLITMMETIPPYWEALKAMEYHRIGNLKTEPEFLKSRSPLFLVDRIQKPLLIAQGANDPRVKESESKQIVNAMKQAGKPVEYVLYTDEGHGFARPENRLHFYAIAEEFLAKYLGGRFEPASNIANHSGVVNPQTTN